MRWEVCNDTKEAIQRGVQTTSAEKSQRTGCNRVRWYVKNSVSVRDNWDVEEMRLKSTAKKRLFPVSTLSDMRKRDCRHAARGQLHQCLRN